MSQNSLNDFDPNLRQQALARRNCKRRIPRNGHLPECSCPHLFLLQLQGLFPQSFCLGGQEGGTEMAGIVDFDVLDGLEEFGRPAASLT